MALDQKRLAELDKATGLSPERMAEFDKITGAEQPEKKNILSTLGSIVGGGAERFGKGLGGALAVGTSEKMREESDAISKFQSEKAYNDAQSAYARGDKAAGDRLMGLSRESQGSIAARADEAAGIYGQGSEDVLKGGVQTAGTLATTGLQPTGLLGKVGQGVLGGATSGFGESKTGEELQGTILGGSVGGALGAAFDLAPKAAKGIFKRTRDVVPEGADAKVFSSVFTVPRQISKRVDPMGTSKELVKHGLKGGLDELDEVSQRVTGQNGVITKITDQVIESTTTPISIGDAYTEAADFIDSNALIDDSVAKKLKLTIQKAVGVAEEQGAKTGSGVGEASASQAFNAQKKLEKLGYQMINKSQAGLQPDARLEAMGEAYLAAADHIANKIDNTQSGEAILSGLKNNEGLRAELGSVSPRLLKQFESAKSLKELRSIAKPWVRLQQMVDTTRDSQNSLFTQAFQNKAKTVGDIVGSGFNAPFKLAAAKLDDPSVNVGIANTLSNYRGGVSSAGNAAVQAGQNLSGALQQSAEQLAPRVGASAGNASKELLNLLQQATIRGANRQPGQE